MAGSHTRPFTSVIAGAALATLCVAGALGITLLLGGILPFTFFLGAVMLSAWFRGTTAGLLALVLSILALAYFIAPPTYSFVVRSDYVPRLATFAVQALLLLWVIAARHHAERALRAARDELEHRVQERTASLQQTNERLQIEIEERTRTERRLARAKRRARERVLAAQFSAVLEERTRLAREIHDTLLQGFTGVSLQLLAAVGRLNGPRDQRESLDEVLTLAQKTLADARQAVWDMRPPALEETELAPALRSVLEQTLAGTSIAMEYVVRGAQHLLEPQVETVVFRVAQEAVANVMKHAEARTVTVRLSYRLRGVRLSIADDGCGFVVDPDLRTYAGHWGLLGMRERASQVRGTLLVRSIPGKGTRITLRVPSHAARSVHVENSA